MLPDELAAVRRAGDIVACDFYVEGIEKGEEVTGGYRLGRILNVDHHAPTPRMRRRISSTNLALERLDAELSRRRVHDYEFSFENLERLLGGRPLDSLAQEALDARLRKREIAEKLVERGGFQEVGPLHFAIVDEPIDGEFFPALLPDAIAIMVANPLSEAPGRLQVKLRLGQAAPPGLALSDLGIPEFDPNYGGRWNAGSNIRVDPRRGHRGTDRSP